MKHRELERNRLNELLDKRGVSALEYDKALFEARTSASKAESTAATLALFRNPVRTEDRRLLDAKVAAAHAEVASAAAQVEQMAMAAPVDGRIIGIFLREGEAVTMTLHDPVILFAPDGPLEVRAEVDEQFFNRIAIGNPAKIFTRNDATTLPGKVREIRPVMGKKSVFSRQATERMDLQIMEVRVEFETPPSWPIGLEVDLEIEVSASGRE
jgi:multidrug resistance efflux pump